MSGENEAVEGIESQIIPWREIGNYYLPSTIGVVCLAWWLSSVNNASLRPTKGYARLAFNSLPQKQGKP